MATQAYTRKLAGGVLSALLYLHKRNIIHRDLKLENILFSTNPHERASAAESIKLVDFGFSRHYLEGEQITNMVGTPFYMSPEALAREKQSTASDVWSFAVIVFMLLTGDPPFDHPSSSTAKTSHTNVYRREGGLTFLVLFAHLHVLGPPWGCTVRADEQTNIIGLAAADESLTGSCYHN